MIDFKEFTITINTTAPNLVSDTLVQALKDNVENNGKQIHQEILTQLFFAALKAEQELWTEEEHKRRDKWETETINQAVKAGRNGEVLPPDAVQIGSLRTNKIINALKEDKTDAD